jgi:hypothetical protein
VRSGVTHAYTYNNANRLKTVSQSRNLLGNLQWPRAARHAGDHELGLDQRRSFICASDADPHPRGDFGSC